MYEEKAQATLKEFDEKKLGFQKIVEQTKEKQAQFKEDLFQFAQKT